MPTITINYEFVQGEPIVTFQVDGNLPVADVHSAINCVNEHLDEKVKAYNKLKGFRQIGHYDPTYRLSYREVLEEIDNLNTLEDEHRVPANKIIEV